MTTNWTTAQTEQAINLRRSGKTWGDIGRLLGKSDTAVRIHIKRYNPEMDYGLPEPEIKSDAPAATATPVQHEPLALPRPPGYLPLERHRQRRLARFTPWPTLTYAVRRSGLAN